MHSRVSYSEWTQFWMKSWICFRPIFGFGERYPTNVVDRLVYKKIIDSMISRVPEILHQFLLITFDNLSKAGQCESQCSVDL